MKNQTIRKILESSEGRDLVEFIKSEIRKLDRTSDIKLTRDRDIAIEVKARKRAVEKLTTILKPFLLFQDFTEDEKKTYEEAVSEYGL